MNVSKRLSIVQAILIPVSFILGIVALILVLNNSFSFSSIFIGGGAIGIFHLLLAIAVLILAIIQVVYYASEKTAGVYLGAGICGILTIIPLIGIFTLIAAFILNIVGATKK